MAAWEKIEPPACPLDGVCSECGLGFAWRDLLNPGCRRELRLFEHAKRGLVASALRTYFGALRPWVLWRWITMAHEMNGRRLAVFVMAGTVVSYAASVGVLGALLVRVDWKMMWWAGADRLSWVHAVAAPVLTRPGYIWPDRVAATVHPIARLALGVWVVLPLTFAMLPQTLRAARVRRMHVVRIWCYSLIGLPIVFAAPVFLSVLAFTVHWAFDQFSVTIVEVAEWADVMDRQRWGVLLGAVLLWQFVWWSLAADRYLRLPRSRWVALAMVVLAVLVVMLFLVFVHPGGVWMLQHLEEPERY